MAFVTAVRRGTAVSSTSNSTSWTPSITFGLNTAISSGDRVLWIWFATADGTPTLSEGSGDGWTPQGQASGGSSACAQAIFTKETTAAYAADASPALTFSSTASEQYSGVLLAFKVSTGASVGLLVGSSAAGSSTNSNPGLVENTSGASRDMTVVCSRGGDSTVTASAAPTNYGNLQTIAGGGTNGASTNTAERQITMASAATEDPGTFTSNTEQWVCWTFAIYESGGAASLNAESGSYSITGTANALLEKKLLVAANATYSLTGTAAAFPKGKSLVAATTSYQITGTAAVFPRARRVAANAGSYVITGTAATLKRALRLVAAAGSYAINGTAATFPRGKQLVAAAGSYVLTGTTNALRQTQVLVAQTGSYAINGTAVALKLAHRLISASGAYSIAGTAVNFVYASAKRLTAAAGSYLYTGTDATLTAVVVTPEPPPFWTPSTSPQETWTPSTSGPENWTADNSHNETWTPD